jgi:simple sugar transport system permease protein
MKNVRKQTVGRKIGNFITNNMVSVLFVIICAFSIPLSRYSANYLFSEIIVG